MKQRRFAIALIVLIALSALFASGQGKPRPEKVADPVCHIMVEKDPQLSAGYKGQTYYFCSSRDRDEFKKNPQKYVP